MTAPKPSEPLDDQELRENLAAIEHERWADWQKWCHKVLRENANDIEIVLQRWDRQIETPYAQLSASEKASDMEQVDRYWPLIKQSYISKQTVAEALETNPDNEARYRLSQEIRELLNERSDNA